MAASQCHWPSIDKMKRPAKVISDLCFSFSEGTIVFRIFHARLDAPGRSLSAPAKALRPLRAAVFALAAGLLPLVWSGTAMAQIAYVANAGINTANRAQLTQDDIMNARRISTDGQPLAKLGEAGTHYRTEQDRTAYFQTVDRLDEARAGRAMDMMSDRELTDYGAWTLLRRQEIYREQGRIQGSSFVQPDAQQKSLADVGVVLAATHLTNQLPKLAGVSIEIVYN